MKTEFRCALTGAWLVAFGALLGVGGLSAQQNQSTVDALDVLQVQPTVYMVARGGSNIAVQIGPDGVVLVDSGTAATADAVVAAIKKLTDKPIRYIINTSADTDHVGGNEKLARAGQSIFTAGGPGAVGASAISAISNEGGASIIATEDVLNRMSAPTGKEASYPTVAWPTESFTRKQKNLYLNNEGIEIIRMPAAHTDGDAIVLFRRSDVLVTGDVFDMTRFPVIDIERGGSIQGEIEALNRLIELTIPSIPMPWKEGGTQVVPGHGRISEQAEVVEYRDMVVIIRDRIQSLIKKGMTLDQIQAASPTKGYNGRFGSDSGPWTTRMFVEAVYKSLTGRRT